VVIDDTGSPTPAINEDDNGESPILDTEPQSQREAEVQAQEVEMAPSSQVSQSPKSAQRNIISDASVIASPEFKPSARVKLNHPAQQVIGSVSDRMKTRRQIQDEVSHICYVSLIEPKNFKEALLDDSWVNAMHEELVQFERNNVWTLVPRPRDMNVIGTKWIFKYKSDENGTVVRNKARLVPQGYT